MSEYGAVTPERLGQVLAENTRLTRENSELREQLHRLADDLEEAQRLNESYTRPHLTAYSNGA